MTVVGHDGSQIVDSASDPDEWLVVEVRTREVCGRWGEREAGLISQTLKISGRRKMRSSDAKVRRQRTIKYLACHQASVVSLVSGAVIGMRLVEIEKQEPGRF